MEVLLLLLMQSHALPICVGGSFLMISFLPTCQRSLFSQLCLHGGLLFSEVHRLVKTLELLLLWLGISVLSGLSVSLFLRIVRWWWVLVALSRRLDFTFATVLSMQSKLIWFFRWNLLLWAQYCFHLLLLLRVHRRRLDQVVPHRGRLSDCWLAHELRVDLIVAESRLLVLLLLLHQLPRLLLGLLAVDHLNELSNRVTLHLFRWSGLRSLRYHFLNFLSRMTVSWSWPGFLILNHFLLCSSLLDFKSLLLILRSGFVLLLIRAVVWSAHGLWPTVHFHLTSRGWFVCSNLTRSACDLVLSLQSWLKVKISLTCIIVRTLHHLRWNVSVYEADRMLEKLRTEVLWTDSLVLATDTSFYSPIWTLIIYLLLLHHCKDVVNPLITLLYQTCISPILAWFRTVSF